MGCFYHGWSVIGAAYECLRVFVSRWMKFCDEKFTFLVSLSESVSLGFRLETICVGRANPSGFVAQLEIPRVSSIIRIGVP